jgi:hypothetical protein
MPSLSPPLSYTSFFSSLEYLKWGVNPRARMLVRGNRRFTRTNVRGTKPLVRGREGCCWIESFCNSKLVVCLFCSLLIASFLPNRSWISYMKDLIEVEGDLIFRPQRLKEQSGSSRTHSFSPSNTRIAALELRRWRCWTRLCWPKEGERKV